MDIWLTWRSTAIKTSIYKSANKNYLYIFEKPKDWRDIQRSYWSFSLPSEWVKMIIIHIYESIFLLLKWPCAISSMLEEQWLQEAGITYEMGENMQIIYHRV